MKLLCLVIVLLSSFVIDGQAQISNSSTITTPSSKVSSSFNNGAYSSDTICSQGPGEMSGYVLNQQGLFGAGQNSNPCTVTCYNQQGAWMVAKPHGAPCRHPNDPNGERYCLNQVCVAYNSSLNEYCRQTLNINENSPNYMALMPYGCTVACLDKSTPSVVQVQFANGMTCHVNRPDGRVASGYCINGACSTMTYRPNNIFNNFLDPRLGQYPFSGSGQNTYGQQNYNPFQNWVGWLGKK